MDVIGLLGWIVKVIWQSICQAPPLFEFIFQGVEQLKPYWNIMPDWLLTILGATIAYYVIAFIRNID